MRPVLILLLLVPLAGVSVLTGVASVADGDFLVLTVSRLPRTAAVMLTGAALAVAGVVMQQLVRNRFVEPGTTGTGEAAALGLLAVTLLAPGAALWLRMGVATLAGLAGTALFLAMIRRLPPQEMLLVPLAGLVWSGVLGAMVLHIGWQTDLLQYVSIWMMTGEFSGIIAGRYELLWLAGLAAGLALLAADRLAILGLGDGVARGLGLNPAAVMRLGLVIVALVTALVMATVGMVPFLGLVVPNIVSRVMGDNLRASLPVTALGGAALLLACDIIGRLLIHPYEIPVGAVLGVVGAVLFLWLLWRAPAHG
ncbi:iron chelate uptake ABC transporter family permease subunit [Tabrizicola sp. DMG-N-6]|uniref:Iron chelate uptake ABC transporter family permease subunit n=1 Tax=Szabonella alba TaxID=2804194 RepID=A0A8K0VBS2_9RHOB|nr:iron chelate uptake ABC transporter family permease subunit [Szabonella alba]MBL4916844.1 iron chelate uptake ABC transporter family permease subunit [Szabonella alba]